MAFFSARHATFEYETLTLSALEHAYRTLGSEQPAQTEADLDTSWEVSVN